MKNSTVYSLIIATLIAGGIFLWWSFSQPQYDYSKVPDVPHHWLAPDIAQLPDNDSGKLIRYGRELVINTANYYGPKGKIAHITNGMNCQNCHLDAGTRIFGNNYGAVAVSYPKFRERKGATEDVVERINDCFERSLAGEKIDTNSHEMRAIVAYMKWLGTSIKKGDKPTGTGIRTLDYLTRAADTVAGKLVYINKCQSCHQQDGRGVFAADGITYTYPPLWGMHSYSIGAGMYRMERLAGFVKYNMPYGTAFTKPQLTDEEAWDVAAYINSRPRANYNIAKDWPVLATKPVDYPFGPYTDTFSEQQHKYGPYAIIKQWKENHKKKS